jgi:HD-GYP domain-containing protein (c-di-GMP phosphodiesterase class II)
VSNGWFILGPVLVIGLLAPGPPRVEHIDVYALAFLAQLAANAGPTLLLQRFGHGVPLADTVRALPWIYRVDAILWPIGLMVAVSAMEAPLATLAIAPLIWLLAHFSRERRERYAAALELNRAYRGTVQLLSDVVEADDNYTGSHCRSVVELVTAVAEELEIDPDDRQELEFAALLHDVGKIAIPKEILNKPAKLTAEEFELMKTHTIEGQQMLDRVGGLLGRVGRIVRSCHERWDGTGYPDGLSGEEIPLAARIVFCCDAYNAMTTDRPYRKGMAPEAALTELRDNAGTQFDPWIVAGLIRVIDRGEARPLPTPEESVRAILAYGTPPTV